MTIKRISVSMLVAILILAICVPALANGFFINRASPVFASANAYLYKDGEAGFSCTTSGQYNSVTLKSASYQYLSNGKWVYGGSLSKPTKFISAKSSYKGSITYTMPSGKTCRLVAVFDADGTTTTAYSSSISF